MPRMLLAGVTTQIWYHATRTSASLRPASSRPTRIVFAARGRARKAVAVPCDKAVHGRAEPAQRREACDSAEPDQLGQYNEQGQPRFKSPQPRSFGSAHVHFPVKLGAREGGLCRHCWLVIIQKPQPSVGIIRLDLRLCPPAEGTGTVKENVVLWRLRHSAAPYVRIYYDTVRRNRAYVRTATARVSGSVKN
jgi:hypothetical protein